MSAYLAVRRLDSICIMTDAAVTRTDNAQLVEISSKVIQWAVPGCLFVGLDWPPFAQKFASLAHFRATDFDGVIEACSDLWDAAHEDLPEDILDRKYGLLIAGWSRANGRTELYRLDPHDGAFTCAVVAIAAANPVPAAAQAFVEQFATEGARETFDPIRDGLPLVKELRRHPAKVGYRIGGYVEVTEIAEAGVRSEIVHVWPQDRVGERIRPEHEGHACRMRGSGLGERSFQPEMRP